MGKYTVYMSGSFKMAIDVKASNVKKAERIAIEILSNDNDLDLEVENVDVIEFED